MRFAGCGSQMRRLNRQGEQYYMQRIRRNHQRVIRLRHCTKGERYGKIVTVYHYLSTLYSRSRPVTSHVHFEITSLISLPSFAMAHRNSMKHYDEPSSSLLRTPPPISTYPNLQGVLPVQSTIGTKTRRQLAESDSRECMRYVSAICVCESGIQ